MQPLAVPLTFPNETFTASVRILNAVPDQTAIDLYQRSAQSSTPGIVSIEADAAASSGSYTVSVQQLAIPETYQTTTGFDTSDTVVGTGTLVITNGETITDVLIDDASASLDGIATAINTGNPSALAGIITDSEGKALLQIATLDYQDSNQLIITVIDADGNDTDEIGLSQLATNQLSIITPAVNAQVTLDGTVFERSTNAITDLISDVTLYLLATSPADTLVELDISEPSLVAEDLLFSDVSPYFTTATGSVIFTATIANDPSTVLFSDRFSLEKNQHHMLAISGTGDNVSARITAEEYRPVATESRLSILHAAPSASVLDVYVLKSDVTPRRWQSSRQQHCAIGYRTIRASPRKLQPHHH